MCLVITFNQVWLLPILILLQVGMYVKCNHTVQSCSIRQQHRQLERVQYVKAIYYFELCSWTPLVATSGALDTIYKLKRFLDTIVFDETLLRC